MSAWIMPPVPGLIEPVPAPEFTVWKTGAVEHVGEFGVFYLYMPKRVVEDPKADPSKVVVVKILRPLASLHFIGGHIVLDETTAALRPGTQPFGTRGPRLVR